MSLSPGSIDFGEIVDGNIVVETVSLSNVGSAPLSVTAIDVTGAGFDLDGANCPGSLAPGASCEIDVEFGPAGTGGFNGSLSVTSNATSSPDVVPLSGSSVDAEPAIQLSPISISFGDVVVGSTEQASITVASIGNVPLSIDNIEVSGAGFSLLGDDCPGSLNPGSDCSIDVEFAPTEDDDYAGSVVVSSSSDASPDFAPLSGTGVLPPEEGLRIAYSVTSNRAAPSDLDGAAVMDTIYVFVTDETGAPAPGVSISQVRFSTNGTIRLIRRVRRMVRSRFLLRWMLLVRAPPIWLPTS